MCNEKSSLSTPLRLAEAEEDLIVPAYFTAYRSLRLTRDALGVLVAEFHSNGSPLTFTARTIRILSRPFTGFRRIGRTRL